MSLPTSEPVPPQQASSLPPARRRRQNRLLVPLNADERSTYLDEIAHRVIPNFDFLLFSAAAGLIAGIAALLDSPALFILAALLAPFMAPAIGLSLASIVGSKKFFLQALGGIALGSLVVFLAGALAGWASLLLPETTFQQAAFHTRFTLPDFLLLTLGSVLITFQVVRSAYTKPLVTSVALAYEIYLPVGMAGFGLAAGVKGLWPDGLVVFGVNLAWLALTGVIVLAILGFRPVTYIGYTLGTTIMLAGIAALIGLSGMQAAASFRLAMAPIVPSRTPTPTLTATITPTLPPPTPSETPTSTLVPSLTPTETFTPAPTPVWATIFASSGGGAIIRKEPTYSSVMVKSLMNGNLVQLLPDTAQRDGVTWAHVRTGDNIEGWVVRSLLVTATPPP